MVSRHAKILRMHCDKYNRDPKDYEPQWNFEWGGNVYGGLSRGVVYQLSGGGLVL